MSVTVDCGEGKHALCVGSGRTAYLFPQESRGPNEPSFPCGCRCHQPPLTEEELSILDKMFAAGEWSGEAGTLRRLIADLRASRVQQTLLKAEVHAYSNRVEELEDQLSACADVISDMEGDLYREPPAIQSIDDDLLTPEQKSTLRTDLRAMAAKRRLAADSAGNIPMG